jgi:hypothetical protein
MIYVNPGSGPVDDSTRENADKNMVAFQADTNSDSFEFVRAEDDGRFAYTLKRGDQTAEIEMPGLPLDEVRYLGPPQNIWHFPRLYVNGSSWVWKYAMSVWDDEEEDPCPS